MTAIPAPATSRPTPPQAPGTQLIQELLVDGCYAVTRHKPECDKIMRLHAQTAMIENGFVWIPKTAPWLAEYLHGGGGGGRSARRETETHRQWGTPDGDLPQSSRTI
jgi:hypothetical protein